MTHIDQAAEHLGQEIAKHAGEFAPRKRNIIRPAPEPEETGVENAADLPPPPTVPLSQNAIRMAVQIDGYISARDEAERSRGAMQQRLHEANARIEQKEATINSQASEIAALKLELDALRSKHTRLYSIIRSLRAATDEVIDMENEG